MNKQHSKNRFNKKLLHRLCIAGIVTSLQMPVYHLVSAADDIADNAPKQSYTIPAGPLGKALSAYAAENGVRLSFDPLLAEGKQTQGLKGEYSVNEGFTELLKDSGLEIIDDQNGGYFVVPARIDLPELGENTVTTDTVNVRASRFKQVGPIPGLALTREEIPGNVQTLSSDEIRKSGAVTIAELMNSRLQSVTVNDYQGNPFQMDVNYRGFTAGPQLGTPQGLSVFMDGIRVNEPFGDVVNWDLIPMNAIASLDVFPGSNPVYGLNTLGGAIALRTKNGFDDPGTSVDVNAGSDGRKQVMMSTGGNNGIVGGFLAINRFKEDGWRDNSPSDVRQVYGKASFRTENLDLHGGVTYVENNLVGNGLVPKEMFDEDNESVFTSPDRTRNTLLQYQIAGAFQVNDTFSVTGQAYRRRSDRKAVTGDINRDFADGDFKDNRFATRRPTADENPVCAWGSTNAYRIPNYYLAPSLFAGISTVHLNNLFGLYSSVDDAIAFGDINPATFNQTLPAGTEAFTAAATAYEQDMFTGTDGGTQNSAVYNSPNTNGFGEPESVYGGLVGPYGWSNAIANVASPSYFTDPNDPFTVYSLIPDDPLNGPDCGIDGDYGANAELAHGQIRVLDDNGNPIWRNGAWDTNTNGTSSGYIDGTPTAIMSSVDIGQIVKGGSMQFNWDTGRHKFMLGASLDQAENTYTNSQLLALLNAEREAYLAPDEIGAEFTGATYPVHNNDFSGSSDTKSLYISETFNPRDNLHINLSARYNYTEVKNTMRVRRNTEEVSLSQGTARWMDYLLCDGDSLEDCDQDLLNNPVPDPDYIPGGSYGGSDYYDPWETEIATYHKLNPAFGISWSPDEKLNLYGNWSQGTRTPSAIELGCAFDDTEVTIPTASGSRTGPRSLINNRACTLPTALSGDPYLPQVVARTLELGARGQFDNGWDWNASIYRTNLQDDIYFVAYTSTKSFFDTIGKTRRQGLELGLSGDAGKFDFKFNYALTDATFESTTQIANADNSSVNHVSTKDDDWNMMTIRPGDRMPGIPLHNVNLNVGYQATPNWRFDLSMVAHSSSFARGNENNEHRGGTHQDVQISDGHGGFRTLRRNFIGDGETPGYAVFNLKTSYKFGQGLTAGLAITNLFDKEYFSASRLDINPFSPSVNGATADNGFNYNSNEWQSTTFVAPGAPRSFWAGVRWAF